MFKMIMKSIKANILTGFLLAGPVVVTILIFNFVFKIATNWLPPAMFTELRGVWNGYLLRLLTLLAVVIVLYLIGVFTRNFIGRRMYQLGDRLFASIPFIKGIYISVRQISESLFTQRKTLFKEVVLVEYPRKGIFSLAFVTAVVPPSVRANMTRHFKSEEAISLFIPTTPNPTSGLLILVPRSDVIPLSMPVTDALTFVMSAGAVAPGEEGDLRPTLLDKLEMWFKHENDNPEEINNAPKASI
ncbi:MAG: DUF502 domain-containing protein [Lentisphaerae bacterium]|nr:DUF502 domain-containing protein [Lentisphaerota bacterium]